MTQAIIFAVFPLLLAYAAFSDLLTMMIPNRVSLLLIATFLGLAYLIGLDAGTVGNHLLAMLVTFLFCFGMFAAGVMGGGDAKLLTATALWFGFGQTLLVFLLLTSVIGGVLTLMLLQARTPAGAYLMARLPLTHNLTNPTIGVPYGIAIGGAGLICYPETVIMQWAMANLI